MKKLILAVFLIVAVFVLFYVYLPVLSYGFTAWATILLIILIICMLANTDMKMNPQTGATKILKAPHRGWWIAISMLCLYIFVLPLITSSAMLRTSEYQTLIGKVAKGEKISQHIAPISMNEIRVVDEDLAMLLGEKILGSQPALGSQVEIGEFSIQQVNKKLFWVAPLLHSGFFKWFNNQDGTPGYVMVSATNERDVRLVQTINNKPIKIKYQPNAYFGSDNARFLYFNGFHSTGLQEFSFEIDDNGKPFWVVSKYEKKIGFSGNDATGVIILDAESGDIKHYSIKTTPIWVDRIQPIDFVEDQLNDWGKYINGYWNFANINKLAITEGLTLVYGQDNRSYWYTGLTSVGKDESAVGFVLVDTRTKETTFYKQSGATEFAAQSSAKGKVQEKGYSASLPIPYNINGIPTYVMTLKDAGGLVKMFAMVAISDYTIVGVGNTMRETLSAFKNVYNMADNKINPQSTTNKKMIEATVARIQNDVNNGNSFYYFQVEGNPGIFVGTSQISAQIPLTMKGDIIKISFDQDSEKVIDISSFENLSLKQKIETIQK
ncbi:MAG: hypothetical protein RLZZ312_1616 [Bacteroidota bacterium]